jgi:hypothetical protein
MAARSGIIALHSINQLETARPNGCAVFCWHTAFHKKFSKTSWSFYKVIA